MTTTTPHPANITSPVTAWEVSFDLYDNDGWPFDCAAVVAAPTLAGVEPAVWRAVHAARVRNASRIDVTSAHRIPAGAALPAPVGTVRIP